MSLIHKHTTEAMVAANRANGLKSTRPLTDPDKIKERLIDLRHGNPSARLIKGMVMLSGEADPSELKMLRTQLALSFPPGSHYEDCLVGEMAENRWRRRRAAVAEAAVIAAQRLEFELEYARKLAGEGRSREGTGQASMAAALGLAALPDSSPKFTLILECLRGVKEVVEREGFGAEGRKCLEAVYGPDPGLAGALLLIKYHEQQNAGAPDACGPASEDAAGRQVFLRILEAEIVCFERLLELEEKARDELAQARLEAQNLPSEADARRITRYEAFLDQQFDRLVKRFKDCKGDRVDAWCPSSD